MGPNTGIIEKNSGMLFLMTLLRYIAIATIIVTQYDHFSDKHQKRIINA